jgi:hypothetical protein
VAAAPPSRPAITAGKGIADTIPRELRTDIYPMKISIVG